MRRPCTQSLGDKAKDAYKDAKDTVKVSLKQSVGQVNGGGSCEMRCCHESPTPRH